MRNTLLLQNLQQKAGLAKANLVPKTDFDTKLQDISKRIISNKTKHLLVESELKRTKNI